MRKRNFEAIVTTRKGTHCFNVFGCTKSGEVLRFIFSFMKRYNITHIVIYPYENSKKYDIETLN